MEGAWHEIELMSSVSLSSVHMQIKCSTNCVCHHFQEQVSTGCQFVFCIFYFRLLINNLTPGICEMAEQNTFTLFFFSV